MYLVGFFLKQINRIVNRVVVRRSSRLCIVQLYNRVIVQLYSRVIVQLYNRVIVQLYDPVTYFTASTISLLNHCTTLFGVSR